MAGTLTIAEKELRDQIGSKRFLIIFGFMVLLSVLAAYQGWFRFHGEARRDDWLRLELICT